MGLHVKWTRNINGSDGWGWAPVISCEQCGELITDAPWAMYVHLPPEQEQDSDIRHVVFTHKGQCMDRLEMDLYGERHDAPCMELNSFLDDLKKNCNLDVCRAEAGGEE